MSEGCLLIHVRSLSEKSGGSQSLSRPQAFNVCVIACFSFSRQLVRCNYSDQYHSPSYTKETKGMNFIENINLEADPVVLLTLFHKL